MNRRELEQCLTRFPRQILCGFETPLQRLKNLEKEGNGTPLYLKRDDLNGVGPGGNKVRALEYLLGAAIHQNADLIIASGKMNSNLCSIAASACCRLGLKCVLVHNSERPDNPSGNALLNALSGIEEHYIGEVSEAERNVYIEELVLRYRKDGHRPFVIENGATTPLGAIGYIHAPMELVNNPEGYAISDLFVSGGNGGLAAGVVLGAALLEQPFHVHVITVENTKERLAQIINDLTEDMLRLLDVSLPLPLYEVMTIHEQYRGDGWGISTKESDATIQTVAAKEGIFLERIYTSKTLWGMLDLTGRDTARMQGACAIHSGGFASLFAQY